MPNPILATGLLMGVLCAAWMYVMGFTGWYKDPDRAVLFVVGAVAIEVAGLVWGLRKTAAEGRTYGGQIVAGTLMAVIAGVIIIGGSLVFTTVAFPDYFRELEAAQRQMLEAQGRSDAEIAEALAANDVSATPMAHAMSGFIGTLITGIVVSAIIAIFVRRRPGNPRTTQ
jgi:hypothetical protein